MPIDDKAYTFRNIPRDVHTLWKTCAFFKGVSMEEFAITALKTACTEYLKDKEAHIKKVEEEKQEKQEKQEGTNINA
jgi:hypothetical protein